MIPTYEGIAFEFLTDPKVITITKDMSHAALKKTIFDANGGYKTLINVFYHQPNHVSDGFVAYNCMKLKHDDDVGKIFFIYSEYSSKGLIKLNATFWCSPEEILAQLQKPITANEIIALMYNEYV